MVGCVSLILLSMDEALFVGLINGCSLVREHSDHYGWELTGNLKSDLKFGLVLN